jgi:hypothetical protein
MTKPAIRRCWSNGWPPPRRRCPTATWWRKCGAPISIASRRSGPRWSPAPRPAKSGTGHPRRISEGGIRVRLADNRAQLDQTFEARQSRMADELAGWPWNACSPAPRIWARWCMDDAGSGKWAVVSRGFPTSTIDYPLPIKEIKWAKFLKSTVPWSSCNCLTPCSASRCGWGKSAWWARSSAATAIPPWRSFTKTRPACGRAKWRKAWAGPCRWNSARACSMPSSTACSGH